MGAASSCRWGDPGLEVPWRRGQQWLQAPGSLSHWADRALVLGEMGVAGKRAFLWPRVTGMARRPPQLSAPGPGPRCRGWTPGHPAPPTAPGGGLGPGQVPGLPPPGACPEPVDIQGPPFVTKGGPGLLPSPLISPPTPCIRTAPFSPRPHSCTRTCVPYMYTLRAPTAHPTPPFTPVL